jgi:cystathionine gamma-synthase/cystathionine gamma-lyase/cystathionine beta-lyase
MKIAHASLATRVVHSGELDRTPGAPVCVPVYHSAMFLTEETGDYHAIKYLRLNNSPSHVQLGRKLAEIEGGEAGLVTASGMAAISTAILSVLGRGGHLLAQRGLYGGTHDFIEHDLETLGLGHTFIDATRSDGWEQALRPETRGVYVEALTNPKLEIADLEAVVRFARTHRLVSLIDSTLATPVNLNPLRLGFDLVLHSATKYLNGHTDLVAGAVIGSADLVETIRRRVNHLGGSADPNACFLLQRGIKTLWLRVETQNRSALEIAGWLEKHPAVERVYYPGLESHPQHARARSLMRGCGGVVSLELKGTAAEADAFLRRLTLPLRTVSLGGVETLATRPAVTAHAGLSAEERERAGISDRLIRMSVGIESTADLLGDIEHALGS